MMIPIQYQNSPRLCAMADTIREAFNAEWTVDQWYSYVMNIETAEGYGLDVWGRIVGANRYVSLVDMNIDYFGFAGTPQKPFNQAVFFLGDSGTGNRSTYRLADPAYRTAIMLRAAMNISDMTCEAINFVLRTTFGNRGDAYVTEIGNCEIEMHFGFSLRDYEFALLNDYAFQPKPAGVRIRTIYQFDPKEVLMFRETNLDNPFGDKPFMNEGAILNERQ